MAGEANGGDGTAGELRKRGGAIIFLQNHANEFMISMAGHAAVLFLISLIPVKKETELPKTTMIIEQTAPEEKQEIKQITDVKVRDMPVEVVDDSTEIVEKEVNVENPVETTSISEVSDAVQENAVLAGTSDNANSPPAILGVGAGNPGANGGLPYGYKSRSKNGKMGAMKKHGGAGTENAVDLSLRWLAEHQEYDGSWDPTKYEGKWFSEKVSSTGLALLAFLGAGYSENIGPFKKTVRKGISWLNQAVEEKKDNPYFGRNYASAIGLMALSEASIFGSSTQTKVNANRIAQMFIDQYKGTAWRYIDGSDQDLSVSGWIILSLKSAKAAELAALKTDRAKDIFEQYKKWVITMTDESRGMGYYEKPGGRESPQMAWVGMFQRQFLGFPKNDPFLVKASENTLQWIETKGWIGGDKLGDIYGIYYGTLATFQQQGVVWKAWNVKMKDSILNTQRKGDPKLLGGSWDPTTGITAEQGGRVMMTALITLCLEIYYRYELMN